MPIAKIGEIHDLKTIDPETIPHVLLEGEMGAAIEWSVWETDHPERVKEHVIKRSESYVQQFLQMMCATMRQTPSSDPVATIDTGNVSRNLYLVGGLFASNVGYQWDVLAGAGIVTFGIVVGTGAVAPTISDYALGTLIAHGAGAGQLQYSAVTFGAPASNATTSQLTITRNHANASGGNITVNEVGLYCRAWDGTPRYIMIIRDVTGGIVVPNGQTLTVNYRPQAVV